MKDESRSLETVSAGLKPTFYNARFLSLGHYTDGSGVKRFKGTKSLRASAPGSRDLYDRVRVGTRAYPYGLGVGLVSIMNDVRVGPTLRQKARVDYNLTDREMFASLDLGDVWEDAGLPSAYAYIRRHPRLKIPTSWAAAFEQLDRALGVDIQT